MNSRPGIIDYFAFAGTYPFGEPGRLTVEMLLAEMDNHGISHSYVTDIGSLFMKDPTDANHRFADACSPFLDRLSPLPVVDLSTNTFEKDIVGYRQRHSIKGIRIAPNYHGYELDEQLCISLLAILSELRLSLFVAREIEDCRFQPACMNVVPMDLKQLLAAINVKHDVPVILNNFNADAIREARLEELATAYFDVAGFDKSFYSMEHLVRDRGTSHLVFGSGVPVLCAGAVLGNVRKSLITPTEVDRILEGIAQ